MLPLFNFTKSDLAGKLGSFGFLYQHCQNVGKAILGSELFVTVTIYVSFVSLLSCIPQRCLALFLLRDYGHDSIGEGHLPCLIFKTDYVSDIQYKMAAWTTSWGRHAGCVQDCTF